MKVATKLLSTALVAATLAACSQRAGSNDNPPQVMVPELPRAGVVVEPVARHGGMVMTVVGYAIEIVVAPKGDVRIYPRDLDDNDLAPAASVGDVTMVTGRGDMQRARLVPDPSLGGLQATLPVPLSPRTEYRVRLRIDGSPLTTGIVVVPGGTETTLALQRARGDEQVVPGAAISTWPTAPPTAIGGGPR